jgi:hypothetical protein
MEKTNNETEKQSNHHHIILNLNPAKAHHCEVPMEHPIGQTTISRPKLPSWTTSRTMSRLQPPH